MPSPKGPRPSLGVDLVEMKRARDFYRAHKTRLPEFFSAPELSYVRASRRPYERVAALLAAKEAAFKASGRAWMGISGFRSIRLSVKRGRLWWRGRALGIFSNRDFVVACAGT